MVWHLHNVLNIFSKTYCLTLMFIMFGAFPLLAYLKTAHFGHFYIFWTTFNALDFIPHIFLTLFLDCTPSWKNFGSCRSMMTNFNLGSPYSSLAMDCFLWWYFVVYCCCFAFTFDVAVAVQITLGNVVRVYPGTIQGLMFYHAKYIYD